MMKSHMPGVDFNHAAGRVPSPAVCALGLLLLLLLLSLLPVTWHFRQHSQALQQQWLARQAGSRPTPVVQAQPLTPALQAELTLAQAQIATPWLALLHDLERAQQPELYWMQLAPDAKRKQVRMTVLAHKRPQGWSLVEHLRQQASLATVKLNSSEATEVNGERMTSLQLEAAWQF